MGSSCSKPIEGDLIKPLASSPAADGSSAVILWSIRGRQQFVSRFMELGGFGLIAKVKFDSDHGDDHGDALAVINPVELSGRLAQELQTLQQETKCTVKIIFSAGDWHHAHLGDWSTQFPEAKLYVASDRVLKKQPLLQDAIVVDRLDPVVPELRQDFDIVPFLGCQQPHWVLGHDKSGSDRVEHVVFHKATRTLFITDHVFAPGDAAAPSLASNTAGFPIKDSDKAAESARNVLALEPKCIVFSHGTEHTFSLKDDDSNTGDTKTCVNLLEKGYKYHFLKE